MVEPVLTYFEITKTAIIMRLCGWGISFKVKKYNYWHSDFFTDQPYYDMGKYRFRFLTPTRFP